MASCAVVSARSNGELSTAVGRSSSGSAASQVPSASAWDAAGVRQRDVGVADVELEPARPGLLGVRVGDVAHALAVPHQPQRRRPRFPLATRTPVPRRTVRPSARR